MKILKYILLFLFSLLVIFSLYYIFAQSNYIYFPDSTISKTPASVGLNYKGIYLKTEDNVRIAAWFVPAKSRRATILFCHGNARNISTRVGLLNMFHELGMDTFIFDYRGYGESTGKPSEKGTYLDSEAAYDYLINERGVASSEIILFGQSLGGAVASRLAAEYPVKALILDSAFTSIKDMGAPLHLVIPAKLFSRFEYSTVEYIKQVEAPVLIIHSRDDEIVPFAHGRELFKAAGKKKIFMEIEGTHGNGYIKSYDIYKDGLKAFIDSL